MGSDAIAVAGEGFDLLAGLNPGDDFAMMMGMWSWDVQKNCFTGDTTCARLYGFDDNKAAAGISFDDVKKAIHKDDRLDFEGALEEALTSKSNPVITYRVRGRDHRWRGVIASGRCLLDGQGRPTQFLGVAVESYRVLRRVRGSLDKLTASTLEARKIAVADKRDFIAHLLDMVLMEIGFALARRELELRKTH